MRLLLAVLILAALAAPASALHVISPEDSDQIQPYIDKARADGQAIKKQEDNITEAKRKHADDKKLDKTIQSDIQSVLEKEPEVIAARAEIARLKQDRVANYDKAVHLTLAAAGLMAPDKATGELQPPEAVVTLVPFDGIKRKWLPTVGDTNEVTDKIDKNGMARHLASAGDGAAFTTPDGVTMIDVNGIDSMQDADPIKTGEPKVNVTPALLALILYHESRHFQLNATPGRNDRNYPGEQDSEIWGSPEQDKAGSTDQDKALKILYPDAKNPDRVALTTITTDHVTFYKQEMSDEHDLLYQARHRLELLREDTKAAAELHGAAQLNELENAFHVAETNLAASKKEQTERRAARTQLAQAYLAEFSSLAGGLCGQGHWDADAVQRYKNDCAGYVSGAIPPALVTQSMQSLAPCAAEVMPILSYCDDADRVQTETLPVLGKYRHDPVVLIPPDLGDAIKTAHEAQDGARLLNLYQDMTNILDGLCGDPSDAWDAYDRLCRDLTQAKGIENKYAARSEHAPDDWGTKLQSSTCARNYLDDVLGMDPPICFGADSAAETANATWFQSQAGSFHRQWHPQQAAPAPAPAPHNTNPKPGPRDPGGNNGGCPPGTHGTPPNCGRAADPL